MTISRRAALGWAAALAAGRAVAAPGRAVVALDWALASTLIALGVPPVGVAEPDLYRVWVGDPALPDGTRDVGLRSQPNLEWTAALRPDLIVIGPLSEPARPVLERVAPVLRCDLFTPERRPLAAAQAVARDLAHRLGADGAATDLLARADRTFDDARRRLAARPPRPVLLVGLLDERHLNVYGAGSLFDDVLSRLALRNAWDRATSIWGTSRVGVEALAAHPDADLVLIEPVPPAAAGALTRPGLWTSLQATRSGRTATVPPAWAFGDVFAAARFAGSLAAALGSHDDAD